MGYFWFLLDLLKIALDYLEEYAEIEPHEVSEATIEQGFGNMWRIEMVSEFGRCTAYLSDTKGRYAVFYMHWHDFCVVCGSTALWRCSGCHGFFCGTHYLKHYAANAPYLKEDSDV